jgi:hypothetical protein
MLPLGLKLRALSETDAGHSPIDVRRCEGFAVNGPDGRIGTAVDVRVDPGTDLPTAMTVRTGLFIHRLVVIGCGEIVCIDADRRQITLRHSRPPGLASLGRHRSWLGATAEHAQQRVGARQ